MADRASATRTTGTVLDRIVADRRERLPEDRRARPEIVLHELIARQPRALDFAARLREGRAMAPPGARLRLIAEVKRASPSKGVFNANLDATTQAREYAQAGATAISVLTEPTFFRGSIEDLAGISNAFAGDSDRPAILRKEFIFDRYQVHEARAHGADALLLIVLMLEPSALADLLELTREHGMEALLEVHDESELEAALTAGARTVGVNNRDLRTFEEDLGTFERIAPLAGDKVTLVAESAIATAAHAERMATAGAHAVLVGEALVRTSNIATRARELMLVPSSESASRTGHS